MVSIVETKFQMSIERPCYNEQTLNEEYNFRKFKPANALRSTKNFLAKNYKPSLGCCNTYLENRLPIIKWLKNYNLKENLLKDIIGGEPKFLMTI